MSNQIARHEKKIQTEIKTTRRAYSKTVITFAAGVLLTCAFNQWAVPLLPGPQAKVELHGMRGNQPLSYAGCTFYMFTLITDQSLESTYLKFAFPQNIRGARVGFPAEWVSGEADSKLAQFWEAGRNSGGECDVIQSGVNLNEGISTMVVNNVLTVRTSKLAAHSAVMGMIAVETYDSAMKSNQPVFEGDYEYAKWGQIAQRKLQFVNSGVIDAK
jgi:hypothetical protein